MAIISFYSKDFDVTDSVRSYVEEKLKPIFTQMGDEVMDIKVDLSRDHHHHKGEVFRAEVNFKVPKSLLRVVDYGESFQAAVDKLEERLKRVVETHKGKQAARNRQVARIKRMVKLFTFWKES
ncbi:MAG: ribosome-associated translation inhibitor RaiA [bacterium]